MDTWLDRFTIHARSEVFLTFFRRYKKHDRAPRKTVAVDVVLCFSSERPLRFHFTPPPTSKALCRRHCYDNATLSLHIHTHTLPAFILRLAVIVSVINRHTYSFYLSSLSSSPPHSRCGTTRGCHCGTCNNIIMYVCVFVWRIHVTFACTRGDRRKIIALPPPPTTTLGYRRRIVCEYRVQYNTHTYTHTHNILVSQSSHYGSVFLYVCI